MWVVSAKERAAVDVDVCLALRGQWEQEQVRSHQRHGSGYGWHVLELVVARALTQVVAQVQGLE